MGVLMPLGNAASGIFFVGHFLEKEYGDDQAND